MTTSNSETSHANTYSIRPATLSDLPHLPAIESSATKLFTTIPGLSHLANDGPMNVKAHKEILGKWRDVGMDLGGQDGGTWVAIARSGGDGDEDTNAEGEEIVGFVVTELLPLVREPGNVGTGTGAGKAEGYFLHIDELSIGAAHQRRGLARRLLGTVKDFAVKLDPCVWRSDDGDSDGNRIRDGCGEPGGLPILGLSLTTFRDVPFNAPFYERFGFKEVQREGVEGVVGVEGARIWREDQERFEDGSGPGARRCWMVCCL